MRSLAIVALASAFYSLPVPASTPTAYQPQHGQNNDAYSSILNTVNLYPFISDNRRWDLFPSLFTHDALVDFDGQQPNASGIPAIRKAVSTTFEKFNSQHLYGSYLVDIHPGGKEANTTTSCQTALFARPQQLPGQVQWTFGVYRDQLVLTSEGWRVKYRKFTVQGVAGNLTVLGIDSIDGRLGSG